VKFIHFIPHVNRPDLTILALNSVKNLWENTIVINNSNENLKETLDSSLSYNFNVLEPSVPLTTAQTYNLIRKIGIKKETDFITFMHNDCELITKDGDILFLEKAKEKFIDTETRVGWLYHDATENEDLFCAYRTDMLKDVGEWDWLSFPFYFLDIDFRRRVEKNAWTLEKVEGILCKHHSDASSTIKSDKLRNFINPYYFSVSSALMSIKWDKLDGDWSQLP
jgi:hypothetical protein